jgi:lipopolysaccharide transport system permease protein
MLVVMMPFFGVYPSWGMLLSPLIILGLVMAALGFGTLLAALTVTYRDVHYLVPFLVQIWMFATPSIYLETADVVGPRGQALLPLNPAHGLILNFRQAMLGGDLDVYSLLVSSGISLVLLVFGCLYFRKVERTFADII